jgi:hypothetical protein
MIKAKRTRWEGYVAGIGKKRNVYRLLVGKLERKRPLGRPRRRWVDNSVNAVREIQLGGKDWTDQDQDRDQRRAFVNTIMKLPAP